MVSTVTVIYYMSMALLQIELYQSSTYFRPNCFDDREVDGQNFDCNDLLKIEGLVRNVCRFPR